MDDTKKTVRISIVLNNTNETLIFRREYRVKGSDVDVDTTWDNHNNLTGAIYDYGAGVSFFGQTNEPPKRIIRVFAYRFDPKSRMFAEEGSK